MKSFSRLLLITLLMSYSLPNTLSKTKRKPKAPACSQGTAYRNCPACGTAHDNAHRQLNVLKNRENIAKQPQPKTVQEIRDPKNAGSLSSSQRVRVRGFVASVDPGGIQETCNCKRTDLRDVHINIVADPSEASDKTKYVVVEFTPRWEKKFGFDDSNYDAMRSSVQSQIGGKWVEFRGYMMEDFVHRKEAANTAAPGTPTCTDSVNDPSPCVWRATTWEVHPVTSFQVVTGP